MTIISYDPNLDLVLAMLRHEYAEACREHPDVLTLPERMNVISEEYLEAVTAHNNGKRKEQLTELLHVMVTAARAVITLIEEADGQRPGEVG